MKVTIIGNGGAFSPENTNTSYVVEHDNKTVLVDCGYNVFGALKKDFPDLLKKINMVAVTHMHDDHIGSLSTLLFYKYFVEGRRDMIVFTSSYLAMDNRYLQSICTGRLLTGSETEDVSYAELKYPGQKFDSKLKISSVPTNHAVIYSTGFIFKNPQLSEGVLITSDTKATAKIERFAVKEGLEHLLVFHDYSAWDSPSQNVHACATDIRNEYSQKFRDAMYLVHDDNMSMVGQVFDFDEDADGSGALSFDTFSEL